ncbi:MAG TPA: 2Fe-2S iron-sulfur cluster-binding protein [Nocardioides sp.]
MNGSDGAPPACTVDGVPVPLPESGVANLRDVLAAGGRQVPQGCAAGHCGSCTVLLAGVPAPSCLVPHHAARDAEVRTVATAASDDLVTALADHGAVQCGFCSPGMVVTLSWLLAGAADDGRTLTADDVREALEGHLCRCTGYRSIVAATLQVAAARSPGAPE